VDLNDLYIPAVYFSQEYEYLCARCWEGSPFWVTVTGEVICEECGVITGIVSVNDLLEIIDVPTSWLFQNPFYLDG